MLIRCLLAVIFFTDPIFSFNINGMLPKPKLTPSALTTTRFFQSENHQRMAPPKKRKLCLVYGGEDLSESVAEIKSRIEYAVENTDSGRFVFSCWID